MKQNNAAILRKRMERLEEASADLERAAENWTFTGRTLWDIRCHRTDLREKARAYASAARALARTVR